MQAGIEFLGGEFVDRAVALKPAHAQEGVRNDSDAKMGFARAVERFLVAGVKMAFVDDLERLRMKGAFEFRPKRVGMAHGLTPAARSGRFLRTENRRAASHKFPLCEAVGQMSILVEDAARAHNCTMEFSPKYFDSIRIGKRQSKDQAKGKARPTAPQEHVCQWQDCNAPGTHRAPVGRQREGEYYHFCFDHVREYNKSYNYFSGLDDESVAKFQKEATIGHRPTWRSASTVGETRPTTQPTRQQRRPRACVPVSPDGISIRLPAGRESCVRSK